MYSVRPKTCTFVVQRLCVRARRARGRTSSCRRALFPFPGLVCKSYMLVYIYTSTCMRVYDIYMWACVRAREV